MSSRGYNETLTTPSNHKDSSGMSLKAFDTHFKTLNNGLLSVARNLSGMHTKVGELEVATKSANDLKHRVDTMEKTLTAHGKVLADIRGMLSEMSRAQQAPPNIAPQLPPHFTAPNAAQQKSRAQLMLEAQRLQAESKANKAKPVVAKPAAAKEDQKVEKVNSVKENTNEDPKEETKEDNKEDINAAVEDLLKATVTSNGTTAEQPQTLDQILASANAVKTHDTYPDSDDEALAAALKAKSGDTESDDEDDAPVVKANAAQVPQPSQPQASQPQSEPPKTVESQKEDSESESEGSDSESESEDNENNEDDEDVEISDVEEEPKPKPAPVKPASHTQTASSKPAPKPAPKPIPRRIVSQKKK